VHALNSDRIAERLAEFGLVTFEAYQAKAQATALPPPDEIPALFWWASAVNGEAGELLEKVKKVYRDHKGETTPDMYQKIVKEMGDVLWYLSAVASALNIKLSDVAGYNLAKLQDREQRGVIQGEGDNR